MRVHAFIYFGVDLPFGYGFWEADRLTALLKTQPPGILLVEYTDTGQAFQHILAAADPADPSIPFTVEVCGSSVPLPLPLPEIPQDVEERLNRYAAELGVDKAAWRLTAGLK